MSILGSVPQISGSEAERVAANKGKGLEEDTPPLLRFEHGEVEDRVAFETTGVVSYLPTVKVFIRAVGDTKCEVPDIVQGWMVKEKLVEKTRKKKVYQTKEVNGEIREVETEIDETYEEPYFFKEEYTPWLDKLKERLHHGKISQNYYDTCLYTYNRWKENNDESRVDGTPVKGWNQVNSAQQRNMMNLGVVSVELAAEMNDETMDALGMGSRDIKARAIRYLAGTSKEAEEIKKLREENDLLKRKNEAQTVENEGRMSAIEEKFAELEKKAQNTPKEPKSKSKAKGKVNGASGNDSEGDETGGDQ